MDPQPKRVPLETWPPSNTPAEVQPAAPQTEATSAVAAGPLSPGQIEALEEQIIAALRTCFDPEIPVNIHELGLVYGIDIEPSGAVGIRMTLTSPACPVAGSLPGEVQAKVQGVAGVTAAKVDLVWDPPWSPDLMSEAARLELGIF